MEDAGAVTGRRKTRCRVDGAFDGFHHRHRIGSDFRVLRLYKKNIFMQALLLFSLFSLSRSKSAPLIDIDSRVRSQWKELTTICPQRSYKSCKGVDRRMWTDASKAKVSPLDFKGLGAWSTFKIETFDSKGKRRAKGGDSWFLLLRDFKQRLRLSVRIFDEGDGSYTAAVHLLHPGNFTLLGGLWYRCVFDTRHPGLSVVAAAVDSKACFMCMGPSSNSLLKCAPHLTPHTAQ